jgi:hypothetical protein
MVASLSFLGARRGGKRLFILGGFFLYKGSMNGIVMGSAGPTENWRKGQKK